jgi:hypothetical protein
VGLPEPTLVVTSTDRQVKQLLSIVYRVGNDLLNFEWPRLVKTHSITLVDGQTSYEMPSDYDAELTQTHWDSSNNNPLIGPLSPAEWQALQNGTVSLSSFERGYRIFGAGLKTFHVNPTPGSNEAGTILLFEYVTKSWIRPKLWTATTVFSAGAYCFYDGYYFRTLVSGTSGTSAPTPTSLNDGGITWALVSTAYTAFTADTDEFLIDEELVGLGVQWNYLASKGLPYMHLEQKYMKDRSVAFAKS